MDQASLCRAHHPGVGRLQSKPEIAIHGYFSLSYGALEKLPQRKWGSISNIEVGFDINIEASGC